MARPGWYMVCYDIADPRRLGQVHRLLKKNGISPQRSVFFIQSKEKDMDRLLDNIALKMVLKEDDLRAYPVESPKKVWTTGGILETYPLVMPGKNVKLPGPNAKKKNKPLWQRLLGR